MPGERTGGASSGTANATASDAMSDSHFSSTVTRVRMRGARNLEFLDGHFERAAAEVDFIKRYVFPGSFIPSVTAITAAMAERTDMRLVNLEDFTPHYARTLREWRHALGANREAALTGGRDEAFLRLWEYYLCYCEGGFAERFIGVSQLLLAKPLNRRDPILTPREVLQPRPGEAA